MKNRIVPVTASLDTRRLQLKALSAEQLRLYLIDPGQLEAALGLAPSLSAADQALRREIGLKLAAMAQADAHMLVWHTYWLVVITADRIGTGLAGFKGPPDEAGQVEIGYGIEPGYRRRGYASEAVAGLVKWAFQASPCRAVTARTMAENEASAAVLRKVGFQQLGRENGELLWRIDRLR